MTEHGGHPGEPVELLVGSSRAQIGVGALVEPDVVIVGGDDRPVTVGAGARIGRGARIGSGTTIEPDCLIGPGVAVGQRNRILWRTLVVGDATIGDDNVIGPSAVIGTEPQHPSRIVSPGRVAIGSRNVLREFITVHLPLHDLTAIGDDCYVMAYAHIPHDAIVDDAVTIANAVQIGGHCRVMHHANLGLSAVLHQNVTVGPGVMVGMGSLVSRDLAPYVLLASRGGVSGLNDVGLSRLGRDAEEIAALTRWYTQNRDPSAWAAALEGEAGWWAGDVRSFLDASRRDVYEMRLRADPAGA